MISFCKVLLSLSSIVVLVLVLVPLVQCEKLSTGVDVTTYVTEQIDTHDVMVFGKSYCPYCRAAFNLLSELLETDVAEAASADTSTTDNNNNNNNKSNNNNPWTLGYINLDILPNDDGPIIQMELLQQTTQKTVPNIFIQGQHIGGNTDLQTLYQSGDLRTLLNEIIQVNQEETTNNGSGSSDNETSEF